MKKIICILAVLMAVLLSMGSAMAPYQSTKSAIIGGKKDIPYLLNDNFEITRAAGSVNGTAAEPGPGTRSVTDTANHLTISSGALTVAGGENTYGDPGLWYGSIARESGRMLIGHLNIGGGTQLHIGWDDNQAGDVTDCFFWILSGSLFAKSASGIMLIAITSQATDYKFANILRASGHFIMWNAGSQWYLLWIDNSSNTGTLYPAVCNYNRVFMCDFLCIPQRLWTPTPLSADSFGGTYPTTDGGGLTGIEAGGSGQTWTTGASATWSISGGELVNDPVAGAELWDADAAVFTAGTYSWEVIETNTISNDSNTLKIEGDGSSQFGAKDYFKDASDLSSDLTVDSWYRISVDAKVDVGDSVRIRVGDGINYYYPHLVENTNFEAKVMVFRALHATNGHIETFGLAAGEIIWYDNLSLKPLTLNQLIAVVDVTTTGDVFAQAELDLVTTGFQAGLALCVDSATNPQNFILAYINRNDAPVPSTVYCTEYVAGVAGDVITAGAVTYGAEYVIKARKIGTSVYVWYNDAYVSSGTCTANTNTKHGVFSTGLSTEVQIDNFFCYPAGSEGEYSELDKYSSKAYRLPKFGPVDGYLMWKEAA